MEFVREPRGFHPIIHELNDALLWWMIEGALASIEVQVWLSVFVLDPLRAEVFNKK